MMKAKLSQKWREVAVGGLTALVIAVLFGLIGLFIAAGVVLVIGIARAVVKGLAKTKS